MLTSQAASFPKVMFSPISCIPAKVTQRGKIDLIDFHQGESSIVSDPGGDLLDELPGLGKHHRSIRDAGWKIRLNAVTTNFPELGCQ